MTPHDLAEYLNVSIATIRSWRRRGIGPPRYLVGHEQVVRYKREEVERWLSDQLVPEVIQTREPQ